MPDHDPESDLSIDLSIVVPMFNEQDNVAPLVAAVIAAVPQGLTFELICVDDYSSDATLDRLRREAQQNPRVKAIALANNCGQTPAMVAGIDLAAGRVIVTMDGDLQNDPADIPALLAEIELGYDIVVGYRVKRQDALITRKLPSWVANRLIALVTRVPIRDNGCTLKAYRASVIQGVPLYSEMHRFIPAMTSLAGTRVKQIPVRHHARLSGDSKYGISRTFRVLGDLIVVRTLLSSLVRPLRFFALLAGTGFLVAFGMLLSAIFAWLTGSGGMIFLANSLLWSSLALFLLFMGMIVELYADLSEDSNGAQVLARLTQTFEG